MTSEDGRGESRGKDLVILLGPPAVGKMAVGSVLSELTGFPLFHNHMTIEPVLGIFPFGSPPFSRIVRRLRDHIFEEVVESDLPGLIFTYVWAFDLPTDREYIEGVRDQFLGRGGRVHFVELRATLEERLRRNRTEERLAAKASKRDVEASEERLLGWEGKHQLNSNGDFPYPDDHWVIDNTDRSARDVAKEIEGRLAVPEGGTR